MDGKVYLKRAEHESERINALSDLQAENEQLEVGQN